MHERPRRIEDARDVDRLLVRAARQEQLCKLQALGGARVGLIPLQRVGSRAPRQERDELSLRRGAIAPRQSYERVDGACQPVSVARGGFGGATVQFAGCLLYTSRCV